MTLDHLVSGSVRVLPASAKKALRMAIRYKEVNVPGYDIAWKGRYENSTDLDGPDYYYPTIAYEDDEGVISASKDEGIGVRCDCLAYRFYYYEANQRAGIHIGKGFPRYQSTSDLPADDGRRKPKNPQGIPGLCKHLLGLQNGLRRKKVIDE